MKPEIRELLVHFEHEMVAGDSYKKRRLARGAAEAIRELYADQESTMDSPGDGRER